MTVRVFVGTLFRSWKGSLRRYGVAVDVPSWDKAGVGCVVRRDVCSRRPTDNVISTAVEATLDVALDTAPIVAIFDKRQRRRFDRGVVCC